VLSISPSRSVTPLPLCYCPFFFYFFFFFCTSLPWMFPLTTPTFFLPAWFDASFEWKEFSLSCLLSLYFFPFCVLFFPSGNASPFPSVSPGRVCIHFSLFSDIQGFSFQLFTRAYSLLFLAVIRPGSFSPTLVSSQYPPPGTPRVF